MKSILICVVIACLFACIRAESESSACTYNGNIGKWVCNYNRSPAGGPVAAFGATDGQNSQVYAGPGYPQGNFNPNFQGYPGFQGGFPGIPGFQGGFPFGRR